VGNLSTTDPNAANTFTYTLAAGGTDNASFTIDGAALKTAAVFDKETKSSYSVRIRSTDQGTLWTEKDFTITVNNVNEAPTDIALSASSVDENQPSGTTVGSISTTDPDVSDTFTHTLAAGGTDNASFTIDGAALKTAAIFNYEVKNSYSIRVRSTDAGTLWTEKDFTITVTNVTEPAVDLAVGFNFPFGVAVDNNNGDVYIADRNNHVVKKLSGGGGSPTVVAGCAIDSSVSPPVCGASTPAGTGDAGYNGDGIAATAAQLNSPTGVAVDASGNLFIADSQNHIIRKVAGGTITTVAGTPETFGAAVNGGTATSATLFGPRGVAVDADGNIYIADNMNQQIRKVIATGVDAGKIMAVAGVAGVAGFNGDDQDPTIAQLNSPLGVAVDADGNIYIADTNKHRVVRVFGEAVDVVAGTGTAGSGAGDLNTPVGVAVKADGSVLYIADLINNRIEEVDF
jgi:hypothetical protein